jgi:hypothetical protein
MNLLTAVLRYIIWFGFYVVLCPSRESIGAETIAENRKMFYFSIAEELYSTPHYSIEKELLSGL